MAAKTSTTRQNVPVWFITGCSSGFGRELAKRVLSQGLRAVVTARDTGKIRDIVADHQDRAMALELDVTNPSQVLSAVQTAERFFGSIDVLVNNAGYGYLGAIEESEEHETRAMFETNFWGLAKLIHAVLPGMRKRRNGCIVNISSIGGFVGFPGVGYYNATKFAVEGLSDALAKEVAPLGIRVVIVEPGPFRTDWAGRSIKKSPQRISDYDKTAGEFSRNICNSSGQQPGDPVRAADAMIQAVQSPHSPLHLFLGATAVQVAKAKLDTIRSTIEDWEKVSLTADFPESQSAQRLLIHV
jgi:NAD(P)-dependent dehydrogenase (short-subunit alcohol dehydrogenase family)